MKKILFILLLLCIMSCKTKYIEIPKVHTEYIVKQQKDTVIKHDSIFQFDSISTYKILDTVYNDKYHVLYRYKTNYLTKYKVDTIHKVDSIPYKVETVKYVNKVNTLQQILIYIGIFSIIVLLVYLGIKLFRK